MIKILYFARLRECLGTAWEQIEPPADGFTVGDVLTLLRGRGGVWAETLGPEQTLMAAVNQEMARPETPLADGDELAFFPPVTGG